MAIYIYSGGILGTCKHGSTTELTGLSDSLPALYVEVAKFDSHKSTQTMPSPPANMTDLGIQTGLRRMSTNSFSHRAYITRPRVRGKEFLPAASSIFRLYFLSSSHIWMKKWNLEYFHDHTLPSILDIIPCFTFKCVTPLLRGRDSAVGIAGWTTKGSEFESRWG
jgi:hypothetical protein